jgi:hypothetical protein
MMLLLVKLMLLVMISIAVAATATTTTICLLTLIGTPAQRLPTARRHAPRYARGGNVPIVIRGTAIFQIGRILVFIVRITRSSTTGTPTKIRLHFFRFAAVQWFVPVLCVIVIELCV